MENALKFTSFHKDFFAAKTGACSIVTEREIVDSQITITGNEAELVIKYFGEESIQRGNVKSNPEKSLKHFLLYQRNGVSNDIELNLVFPKPDKNELRLYLSSQRGFKPASHDIWFLYINNSNRLVIGSLDERSWYNLGQEDQEDPEYQNEVELFLQGRIATSQTGSRTIYQRNPKLAVLRFQSTDYTCEIDNNHRTFIAQSTKLPYVEAHHFIPMKFQHLFTTPLDNFENIVSLCPTCHRGIHHAVIEYKQELITNIYEKRPQLKHQYSIDDIAQFYNSIKVPV